ncbi:probable peroxisomal half abc transporter [Phaffia rhodozyma]|uniref:Probable peroxisomal half abc transporter n=1 Tax=Phaffia rhodozyma TaxID=264483 RepID=A0A0F7SP40_PHARH|nr:probable peroxisomal half abc transporter [Phaffia rhodozyma]
MSGAVLSKLAGKHIPSFILQHALVLQSSPVRRRVYLSLLISLILARSAAFKSPWTESDEKRKERKRLEALTPLTTPQFEKESADLFIRSTDGRSRTLLLPFKGRVSKVVIRPISEKTFSAHVKYFKPLPPNTKLGVNASFLKQLRAVMMILLPRFRCRETFMLILHSWFLIQRTLLSVVGARLDGRIVRDLISADKEGFLKGIMLWFALALPSTYTNAMIHYLQSKLALAFRTRLTRYVHDLYLNDKQNYYKFCMGLGVPPGMDSSINTNINEGRTLLGRKRKPLEEGGAESGGGADQFITTDVAMFCDTLAALYGNVCKPMLDLIIFTAQLSSSLGLYGTIGLFANYGFTAWILRSVSPAFGKLAAIQARLEGEYRQGVGRIGREAEEIAFYQGGRTEHAILWKAYLKLMKHCNNIFKIRIAYGMTEDFVIKYLWSLMSIPIFLGTKSLGSAKDATEGNEENEQVASRTEGYISNRRLLIALADAGGRLMLSYKDIAQLSGYTNRVYTLISSLHALNNEDYPVNPRPSVLADGEPFYDLASVSGTVQEGVNRVELMDVPIVAPAGGAEGAKRGGEELVKSLNLRVERGNHLLIVGPNGVGKSSIARVIGKIWPVWSGNLVRPSKEDIFFVPQKPYLSLGSLRDQIIYPDSYADMKAAGRTDAELMSILEAVHLAYIPAREGGWETRKEWKDVLSGGEKQRVGFARVFYHKPSFVVLDDCSSAVSTDVEGLMYQHAKDMGITLITISHRPSLMKYHQILLRLTGSAGTVDGHPPWELSKIGTEEEQQSLEVEIQSIRENLKDVDNWRSRLEVIKEQLSATRVDYKRCILH